MANSVFGYSDYRAYLIEHAQAMQRKNARWSYGGWAKRLGLKTTSSITKIIQGQRNPGEQLTEALVQYFAFDPNSAAHFRDLVRLQRFKKDPRLCLLLAEKLPVKSGRSTRLLKPAEFDRLSRWYFLAIREMVKLDGFVEDPHWITHRLRFPVGRGDVRPVIRLLLKQNILARDAKGRLQCTDPHIHTVGDVPQESIKLYHEGTLDLAARALRAVAVEEREFGSETFVMKKSDMPRAKKFLREIKSEFLKSFEADSGDAIYQLQFQLFPLTK